MAAPLALLGPALRMLATQGVKKAAMQTAKGAVKNKAKNFVTGKGKKKDSKGALVRADDIVETEQQSSEAAQRISPQKLLPPSVDSPALPSATVSSTGKVSYEKLSQRLDNIVGITGALNKAFKQQLKDKKKTAKAVQKRKQTANKKAREEKLEKGKKVLGIGGAVMTASKNLGITDFITNILLGGLLLFLLTQGPKIAKAFTELGASLSQAFQILRAVLKGLGATTRGLTRSVGALGRAGFRTALAPFQLVGKGVNKLFRAVGSALYNFGVKTINLIRKARGLPPIKKTPPGEPTKVTPTGPGRSARPAGFVPRSDARGNQVAGRGQQYRQNLARTQVSATTTPSRPSRTAAFRANLQTGTAFGGRGARLQRAAYGTTIKANNFLSKLFGITNPQQVQALQQASPALKKGSNFMKGARIPVVGPLIVFTLNALDPTQTIGQAAFKAIGMGLGEFLGFAIPIPVLGPLIGGLLGEVLGDVAYSLIVEKSTAKATEKIKNAVQGVANLGGKILDWAKGLVGRFFDALPKLEIPGWVPGIGGKEIIDPTAILGPRALIETPKAFLTALFQPEKKEEGEVEELQEDTVEEPRKIMTEIEFYNAGVEDPSLGIDYQAYVDSLNPEPATPVQPSTSAASRSASVVNKSASYEDGAGQTIVVPLPPQAQQPVMSPQQQGAIIKVGGSTKDVLNSYYKAQLLGFLYKQG